VNSWFRVRNKKKERENKEDIEKVFNRAIIDHNNAEKMANYLVKKEYQ
jgi:hypothetical protein